MRQGIRTLSQELPEVSGGQDKKNPESRHIYECQLSGFTAKGKASLSNYIITSAISWINRIRNTMAIGYTVAYATPGILLSVIESAAARPGVLVIPPVHTSGNGT